MEIHEPKILSEYQCGNEISIDCQLEYNFAVTNSNLDAFYLRCAIEGGTHTLRSSCSLCCHENELSGDYLHSMLRGCSNLNDNVQYCDDDSDSINSQVCMCDADLCNDLCEDCEHGPRSDGLKCYSCNPKDSWCDDIDDVIDHGNIATIVCPTNKCLISGYLTIMQIQELKAGICLG